MIEEIKRRASHYFKMDFEFKGIELEDGSVKNVPVEDIVFKDKNE
jgi:hypothetical protein